MCPHQTLIMIELYECCFMLVLTGGVTCFFFPLVLPNGFAGREFGIEPTYRHTD